MYVLLTQVEVKTLHQGVKRDAEVAHFADQDDIACRGCPIAYIAQPLHSTTAQHHE